MWDIGHVAQKVVEFLLDRIQFSLAGFQFITKGSNLEQQRLDILSCGFCLADALRVTVSLRLQLLGSDLDFLALSLQGLQPVAIQFKAALGQRLADGLHILT